MTLKISLGSNNNVELVFDLEPTPIAQLWKERMLARTPWPMDHPDRFYSFNSIEQEKEKAIHIIKDCVDTINQYQHIVDRPFEFTQDYLNYLHHVFEEYHGLLDQQNTEFWDQAPHAVKTALANLNLAVHRCESVYRDVSPRLVCTWFGMPKVKKLDLDLQRQYGTLDISFGGVYLNYVEIGKTLFELAIDEDNYIADEAFKPFDFYSADFVVYFFDTTTQDKIKQQELCKNYFEKNKEFFQSKGIDSHQDTQALPLKFKVAQLRYTDQHSIIEDIKRYQYVNSVELI